MNKKGLIIVASIIGVLLLCVCCGVSVTLILAQQAAKTTTSQSTDNNKVDDAFIKDSKVFENSNIKFNYPENWSKETSSSQYIVVSLSAEKVNGVIPANFNVVNEDISGAGIYTAEKYYDLNYNNLVKDYPELNFESKKVKTTVNGKDAYYHVLKSTNTDGDALTQLQIITINGDRGWVFTLSSSPSNYSKYKAISDNIMKTVEFK